MSHPTGDPQPDADDAVTADDRLLDDLAAGTQPPTPEQIAALLAAWRDQIRRGT